MFQKQKHRVPVLLTSQRHPSGPSLAWLSPATWDWWCGGIGIESLGQQGVNAFVERFLIRLSQCSRFVLMVDPLQRGSPFPSPLLLPVVV